jgi:hypothetical protein
VSSNSIKEEEEDEEDQRKITSKSAYYFRFPWEFEQAHLLKWQNSIVSLYELERRRKIR